MAKFLTHMEHTEEGAKLMLTEEQEKNCRVVYRRSEEDPEHFVFAGLWNSEQEYPDDHVIVPLRSVYDGLSREYNAETAFVNVLGSSKDPRPSDVTSWIDLITSKLSGYITNTCCAQRDKNYDIRTDNKIDMKCTNGGFDVVGGHVLIGTKIPKHVGEGGKVWLLPICHAHNTGAESGGGYYMKLGRVMKAVGLKDYLKRSQVETALAKEAALAAEV